MEFSADHLFEVNSFSWKMKDFCLNICERRIAAVVCVEWKQFNSFKLQSWNAWKTLRSMWKIMNDSREIRPNRLNLWSHRNYIAQMVEKIEIKLRKIETSNWATAQITCTVTSSTAFFASFISPWWICYWIHCFQLLFNWSNENGFHSSQQKNTKTIWGFYLISTHHKYIYAE